MTETNPKEGNAIAAPYFGRAAWQVTDLERDPAWIRPLSDTEIDELEGALRAVQRRGVALLDITREDFPLPDFSATVKRVAEELEGGRGLLVR